MNIADENAMYMLLAALATACTNWTTGPVEEEAPASAATGSLPERPTSEEAHSDAPVQSKPLPRPPDLPFLSRPEFSGCVHPGVAEQCTDGWCRIPAGCFVLGSPDDEPLRARFTEQQARVTLTHDFEIQQSELTLGEWRQTGLDVPNRATGPRGQEVAPCLEDRCPVNRATWYQGLQYANWLSEQRGLEPCFRVYDCARRSDSDTFGEACSVELLSDSVYECEGYRMPTSAEWEYAARAGTTTAFYSGPATSFDDNYGCHADPNLLSVAWYCANSPEGREQAVGALPANAWAYTMCLAMSESGLSTELEDCPSRTRASIPKQHWIRQGEQSREAAGFSTHTPFVGRLQASTGRATITMPAFVSSAPWARALCPPSTTSLRRTVPARSERWTIFSAILKSACNGRACPVTDTSCRMCTFTVDRIRWAPVTPDDPGPTGMVSLQRGAEHYFGAGTARFQAFTDAAANHGITPDSVP